MFQTEKELKPRIEWKKKGKEVSFVYFGDQFRGEQRAAPKAFRGWGGGAGSSTGRYVGQKKADE